MSQSIEERGRWRRIDRLVKTVPNLVTRLGCRRRDHVLRESIDNVPRDTPEEILERRRDMARKCQR